MNRYAMTSLAAWMLLMGVPALAQEAAPKPPTEAAAAEADAKLAGVRARGRSTPARESQDADEQLGKAVKKTDAEASAKGDVTIAARIATEFKETTDAVLSERSRLGAGWGELLLAHTLVGESKTGLTIDQVFQLRSEGMGWGQIARGMDLKLGKLTSALQADERAATGLTKAEGKSAHDGGATGQDHAAPAAARASAAHARIGGGAERALPRGHGGR